MNGIDARKCVVVKRNNKNIKLRKGSALKVEIIKMVSYSKLKKVVIDFIDSQATNYDVLAGYGKDFNAGTLLDEIGVTAPVRAHMPKGFNKVMRNLVGDIWQDVGPLDLVQMDTIGDFITLACGQSGIALPAGEPT